jgi:hypothetical protein
VTTLDLGSLDLVPADGTSRHWLRATLLVRGIEHFVDLLAVRDFMQRAMTSELDEMLDLHHMACGVDGPFATIEYDGKPYVLFVTPSAA